MPSSKSPSSCPRCGAAFPLDAPQGLCPACLLVGVDDIPLVFPSSILKTQITTRGAFSPTAEGAPADPVSIGVYQIRECLGKGGFGIVYRAEQTEPLRREVALKIVKPGMDSHEIIRRFEAERHSLARMEHPNIATVLDAGTMDNGRPYFVMELVRGEPITDYCDHHRLSIRERLALFIPVCQAVHHAHQKSILHRDLKPSNILVTEVDGKAVPKVIDFGIAKALGGDDLDPEVTLQRTLEGTVMGTPQYMSPEQAGAGDMDTRSDIYTLGVILYELLTGSPPLSYEALRHAGLQEILRLIREAPPVRPSHRVIPASKATSKISQYRQSEPTKLNRTLRGDLDWITLKALEKERERRYGSAADLAQDLERHLAHEPVAAGPPDLRYRLRKLVERNRLAFGAAASVLLLLIAGITASTWLWRVAVAERVLKQTEFARAEREKKAAQKQLIAAAQSEFYQADRLFSVASKLDQASDPSDRLRQQNTQEGLAHLSKAIEFDPDNALFRKRFGLEVVIRRDTLRRLPIQYFQHEKRVRSASFSPDGTRVITTSDDDTVKVWDAVTGRGLVTLKHEKWVDSARFSPDGTRVLTASGHIAKIWDAATGKALVTFQHEKPVDSASFSPDGTRVLTASGHIARTWNAATGKAFVTFQHEKPVGSASFSPDGSRVLTASGDIAKIWDSATGQAVVTLQHDISVNFASFNPDGTRVLTNNLLEAKIWDAVTGQALVYLELGVWSASFSPDGTRVLTASAHIAKIWDASTGQALVALQHDAQVILPSFSPDGTRVITTSDDDTVKVWDAATGEALVTLQHDARVNSVSFSPDGAQLVTASDDKAKVWAVTRGQALVTLQHDARVNSASFSPDGTRVLISSGDIANIWDAATGKALVMFQHEKPINSASFSPNGTRVLTASGHIAKIWNAVTGKALVTFQHEKPVSSASFSPDGTRVLTASGDIAKIWDSATGQAVVTLQHDISVNFASFNPDGTRVLTNNLLETKIWDAVTGQALVYLELGVVWSGSFSPDGTRVLTAGGQIAKIWDAVTGKVLSYLHNANNVNLASFSPDGTLLATSGEDRVTKILHAVSGRTLATIRHENEVTSMSFIPDGTCLVTASADKMAKIWDTATGQALGTFQHNDRIRPDCFSPDGTRMVTAIADKAAKIWDINIDKKMTVSGDVRDTKIYKILSKFLTGVALTSDGKMQSTFPQIQRLNYPITSLLTKTSPVEKLAYWVLENGPSATLSPISTATNRDRFEALLANGDDASLRQAHDLFPANALPLFVIADALGQSNTSTMTPEVSEMIKANDKKRADWLREYAMKHLPEDDQVWLRAAQLLRARGVTGYADRAAEKAIALNPKNAELLAPPAPQRNTSPAPGPIPPAK